MRILFLASLIGLLASSGVHLAVANGLPLPEWVFLLQVGVLALSMPLAWSVRQPPQGAPRLNYWWNAWREAPLQLQLLTLVLGVYVLQQTYGWLSGPSLERGGLFLRLISSAWMCAYAVEAAFLFAASGQRRTR